MKKLVALLMVFVMLTLSACSPGAGESNSSSESSDSYEIALVTDMGSIDDRGFNQGAWEGVKRYAEEANISYQYYRPTEKSVDGYITGIEMAINGGAKIVVCPGFSYEPAVYKAQEMYPEIKFIILDGRPQLGDYVEYKTAENTYSIIYAEDQAGFLAGYAAVVDGYRELGFLGGMAVPAVVRYGYGYIQGAEYAAKELGLAKGDVVVKYGYTGGFDPLPEYQTKAASWYQSGTEVIFACGGMIINNVAAAAEADGNGKSIGVDIDQSAESETIITSAMKLLGNTVYEGIKMYYEGNFQGGVNAVLGADVDAIGLPLDFSHFSIFDQEKYDMIFNVLAEDTDGVSSMMIKDATENGTAVSLEDLANAMEIVEIQEVN